MSGIGRGIARAFSEQDAKAVVVADVLGKPRQGETPTQDLIEDDTKTRSVFVETDVTKLSDIEAAVGAADEFGGIDVMANASATPSRPRPTVTSTSRPTSPAPPTAVPGR